MSKKLPFSNIFLKEEEVKEASNELLTKKHKININSAEINSFWFRNPSDYSEFKQLYTTIDNCNLSKLLRIPHSINKEIAEYGTGQFVQCNNSKCNNDIPILFQDKQIYNNNHKNSNKLRYKWSQEYDEYYCDECMDSAKVCDCNCCEQLHFIPDCDKCNECKSYMCNCECVCAQTH
eukprot:535213_1